jgi:hypothetical protein
VPWGGHIIFLELENTIFLYKFSRIGSGLKRDLMIVYTTNY